MNSNTRLICTIVVAAVMGWAAGVAAQDTVNSATQLYRSAAYEEALAAFDRLKAAGDASLDIKTVDRYRALCLIALGRQADAEQAIEQAVSADPYYLPPEAEVSPRVLATYRETRNRLLPQIAETRYTAAKAAFDKKDYSNALDGFTRLNTLLQMPELATGGPSSVGDLKALSASFLDLCRKALDPALAAPPKPAEPEPPPPPAPPRIHGPEDAGVTAPVIIQQKLPPYPMPTGLQAAITGRKGVLEVVIDETGKVESAVMRQSMGSIYDNSVLQATKQWRYQPAVKDGKPVKFRKLIQISMS